MPFLCSNSMLCSLEDRTSILRYNLFIITCICVHVLTTSETTIHLCCSATSVVSDSVRPHRWQPTRLPCPWDSPGKNTGVRCHFLLQCMKVKSEREVAQLCPTFSNPMDCSLPGSSVHGIFQARVLESGAIAFSNNSSHHPSKQIAGMCWTLSKG